MAGSTFGSSTLSRRQLLVAGAASVGTLALFGCTWTPRNANYSGGSDMQQEVTDWLAR